MECVRRLVLREAGFMWGVIKTSSVTKGVTATSIILLIMSAISNML